MSAVIIGSSKGIGLEMVRQLAHHAVAARPTLTSAGVPRCSRVLAATRRPSEALRDLAAEHDHLQIVEVDTQSSSSLAQLAEAVPGHSLRTLVHVAGMLHSDRVKPERRVEDVNLASMQAVFGVNTFGPALVLGAFASHLSAQKPREGRPVHAGFLSARVGSISDNAGLGGWYTYRASKAALNQLVKTASIEFQRRNAQAVIAALHPGTVATDLSQPVSHAALRAHTHWHRRGTLEHTAAPAQFQKNVRPEKLFSVERAAEQLLCVLHGCETGDFRAWDGSTIPW